jgi:hypothetical protein
VTPGSHRRILIRKISAGSVPFGATVPGPTPRRSQEMPTAQDPRGWPPPETGPRPVERYPSVVDYGVLRELPAPVQLVAVPVLLPLEAAITSVNLLRNAEALLGELVYLLRALRPAVTTMSQAYADGHFAPMLRTFDQIQQGTDAIAFAWAPFSAMRDAVTPGQGRRVITGPPGQPVPPPAPPAAPAPPTMVDWLGGLIARPIRMVPVVGDLVMPGPDDPGRPPGAPRAAGTRGAPLPYGAPPWSTRPAGPASRYPQAPYPPAAYPQAPYPRPGYPEAGYPEPRYPDSRSGYSDSRYADSRYADAGQRPSGHPAPGHPAPDGGEAPEPDHPRPLLRTPEALSPVIDPVLDRVGPLLPGPMRRLFGGR